MRIAFEIESETSDLYQVILSSGEDAFFTPDDLYDIVGDEIEVVEVDLVRISGSNPATLNTLSLMAKGIAKSFSENEKAVLYYYCDDLAEIPNVRDKHDLLPQEYRSKLFSHLFTRYLYANGIDDILDVEITINQTSSPLYMHLIARMCHLPYVMKLKEYIVLNYGK